MFKLATSIIVLASLFVAVFAAPAPIPLNISMGAYSPAMVVGDGTIALQGSDTASKLISSLEGADVDGAAGGAAVAGADAGAGVVQAGVVNPATPQNGINGIGRKVIPVEAES